MDVLYPQGPAAVPNGLTAASSRYKRHAWLATLGLLFFIAVYFSLAGWFALTAWRLLVGLAHANSDKSLGNLIGGVASAFLAIFMFKALVFVKRGENNKDLEITPADQPQLFAFINRLADEIGAPRAHRVFLSGRVNAAVFYDLSIVNFFIPSRKNLEIGLALVNALNLGEFKAVLAHEFGHFAQRSMAVGRWVYIAQQIASHIVAKRDALDTFLKKLSGIDIRIAWAGWLLRIIVWAIRSLVEVLFRVVVLAERALSREMEFQADLVSVSVTGSDALINALHKLSAADDAWNRTLGFASDELREKRGVKDLFSVQQRVVEKMREILDDRDYGNSPGVGTPDRRLFKAALAAPPQMWSTHPASSDREENAKRTFVSAPIDDRSAWDLFVDAASLRERASRHLVDKDDFTPVAIEESLSKLDEFYDKTYLDRRFRGAYLGRSIVKRVKTPVELYDSPPADLLQALSALYPESLAQDIELIRELESEKGMLEALRAGYLTAPGGVIQHRGVQISRKQLPDAISKVQLEIDDVSQRIWQHDSNCRTAHLAAATTLGASWADYLKGLLAIHHYAEHADADLRDAQALLINTVNVAFADGKVTASEAQKIKEHGTSLQTVMERIHKEIPDVIPDRTVLKRMKKESWRDAVEELKLGSPNDANLGDWLNVVHGWVASLGNSLSSLRWCSLEQLLAAESQIAQFLKQQMQPGEAPPASKVPSTYPVLLPGKERPKQTKLDWWDRFQTANGWIPATARSVAAAAIIGCVFWIGNMTGTGTIYVYNGLGTVVETQLAKHKLTIAPFSSQSIDVGSEKHVHVRTSTHSGELVEEFDADITGDSASDIYNIASSGVLVSWTAVYGGFDTPNEHVLPQARWTTTSADFVFREPPNSISTRGGRETRSVLSGYSGESIERIFTMLKNDTTSQSRMVAQHARWDESSHPSTYQWIMAASSLPEFPDILKQRLHDAPNDVLLLRVEQDYAQGDAHAAACARHAKLAGESPNDSNLQYLVVRCVEDKDQQSRQFVALQHRWPNNPWIAQAAGYVYGGAMRWQDADKLFSFAQSSLPALRATLVDEMVRVKRAQADDEHVSLSGMHGISDRVSALASLDSTVNSKYDQLRGYQWLARGDLKQAIQANNVAPDERQRMIRLIGASSGASIAQIESALALHDDQGLDDDTYLPTLALKAKYSKRLDELLPLASKYFGREGEQIMKAFERLRSHASAAVVDETLQGIEPKSRGHFYAAAAVLLGDQCPQQWRRLARQLLFATERPYIRV